MKLAVTGATGYIGIHLIRCAMHYGHEVVFLTRRKPSQSVGHWVAFDLNAPADIKVPVDVDVVIHLAGYTSASSETNQAAEVLAIRALLTASLTAGASFIMLSSQTAAADAPTVYGRTKWRLEQEVIALHGLVVRAGQVYGGVERGLFGELVKHLRALPIVPALIPALHVQPIHVDDLASGLLVLAYARPKDRPVISLASETPVSFTRFLSTIVSGRLRRTSIMLPTPVVTLSWASLLLRWIFGARVDLSRIDSLRKLRPMETTDDLNAIGLKLRPLSSGMHISGHDRRRQLVLEGRAMLSYVLRCPPDQGTIRRYARAVETLRDGLALRLPGLFLRLPSTIAMIDFPASNRAELCWRVDAASAIGEASRIGAPRFLNIGRGSRASGATARITLAILTAITWRLVGQLSAPLVNRAMRSRSE